MTRDGSSLQHHVRPSNGSTEMDRVLVLPGGAADEDADQVRDLGKGEQEENAGNEGVSEEDAEVHSESWQEPSAPKKKTSAGYLPSAAEVEEHCKTHCPFRCWCEWCVAARRQNLPHSSRTDAEQSREISEVHCDYCFFRPRPGEGSCATLCIER